MKKNLLLGALGFLRFFLPEALSSLFSSSAIPTTHAIVAEIDTVTSWLCRDQLV